MHSLSICRTCPRDQPTSGAPSAALAKQLREFCERLGVAVLRVNWARGDPTKDIKILQDRDNLLMVMKDGAYHKHPGAMTGEAQTARTGVRSVWESA